ncbi:hypothetical protein A4A49_53470, partial [Nicotiana attenuata]
FSSTFFLSLFLADLVYDLISLAQPIFEAFSFFYKNIFLYLSSPIEFSLLTAKIFPLAFSFFDNNIFPYLIFSHRIQLNCTSPYSKRIRQLLQ